MRQLLEHKGKELISAQGIRVPAGEVATTPEKASQIADALGNTVVIKAQVPIGGRGKSGGISVVPATEVARVAAEMIGSDIRGFVADSVLVEALVADSMELYIAFTIDPSKKSAVLMVSGRGGIDVETGAAGHVKTVEIPSGLGLQEWHVLRVASDAGIDRSHFKALHEVATALYRTFLDTGASLVEVNPLFLTPHGDLIAGDVRIIPDEAATKVSESSKATDHRQFDLLILDPAGAVGLITTGAGGTMLLLDLLTDAGHRPINFCDIRTGAPVGRQERFEIALRDLRAVSSMKCLVINIFAGVTNLDDLVPDLLGALARVPLDSPVVARLKGRGAPAARAKLEEAGITTVGELPELLAEVTAVVGDRGLVLGDHRAPIQEGTRR
ncbi:succinyl-CoA synthetase beta subunit [Rhodococcus sp. OAS809]|uniref:ATP-grasp domain-containing protein n=1 Tax=Rhodococcus sp. OAS809 TaxID=2663874 RepID=UPI00178B51CE